MRDGRMILKKLNLSNNDFSCTDITKLLKSLTMFENLQVLDLSLNDFSDIFIEDLETFFT